ncbi:cupin domain-containing protein [Pseudidiomarina salilacus]|uniref:cupin domain-containing protein n=1 Tax=Pseudidiomarina salilacus TaxID=3384452 RepID=UPI003984E652
MTAFTLQIDRQAFLDEYWQQRPLLIRGGFADFADPIEAELLAGLAMEEGVDARIIRHQNDQWDVLHGPFAEYESFGEADWTLLVQAVNEWFPEVQQLLSAFRFLPDWRLDDVMVSFATAGGGVGAHLDQYDVFIIQGAGRRHWRVGERMSGLIEHCPHADLKQLRDVDFPTVIDAVLELGDVLYIPAGCPHHGIALEPSLNYSVGFRAPNSAEFLAQIADQLLASDTVYPRYQDPAIDAKQAPFLVNPQEIAAVQQLLQQQLANEQGQQAILQVMSQAKRPLPQPEHAIDEQQLLQFAATDMLIGRSPGARILLDTREQLYAQGERLGFCPSSPARDALLAIWDERPLAECDVLLADQQLRRWTCELLNLGVFYLVQELDED